MAEEKNRASGADYEVGYRKPPVHSRFKPGDDARRKKGRKKGSENIATILERVAFTKVKVPMNGRTRTMSMMELAYRSLANKAAKGDVPAIRHFSDLLATHLSKSAETPDEPLSDEDADILRAFLQRNGGDDGE